MILVIPAMELVQGSCTRQTHTTPDCSSEAAMNLRPPDLARLWRTENAKTIHITDQDSLRGDDDAANHQTILDIIQSVDIPVQLNTDVRTVGECVRWLDQGVFRVIVSTLLLDDPDGLQSLIKEYTSSRIVLGIRAHSGRVRFGDEYPSISDTDFAARARDCGLQRIVYSDASWEGTYEGPDVNTLVRIARQSGMRVTAAGGIDSPEELWALNELLSENIDSVVVGRAIFENRFPCQLMWRAIENEIFSTTGPTS
ncbi:MAG: HisA/HisF-related TIM barrel protein [Candidatus Kapaibacterium sp.]